MNLTRIQNPTEKDMERIQKYNKASERIMNCLPEKEGIKNERVIKIVVVSDGSEDWKGTNIGDLVRYIQYNNFEIIESQIYSVFDLLYNNYSEKLLAIMKNSKMFQSINQKI